MSWKKFETAPKDRPILVFKRETLKEERVFVIYWDESLEQWELAGQLDYESCERAGFNKDFLPDYWDDLPELPKEDRE